MDGDNVRGCVTISSSGIDFGKSQGGHMIHAHSLCPLASHTLWIGASYSASKKISLPSPVPCSSRRVYRSKNSRWSRSWS